jgi:hypothetical protein
MKIKLISSSNFVNVYHISNYSDEFKKKYPKKFIIVGLISGTKQIATNESTIGQSIFNHSFIGYIFTYDAAFKTTFPGNSLENDVYTYPACLDEYFQSSEPLDLILRLSPQPAMEVPFGFNEIIVRTNSFQLLDKDNYFKIMDGDSKDNIAKIKKNILSIIKNSLLISPTVDSNLEHWLLNFINNPFYTQIKTPIMFKSGISIDNNSFLKKIIIEYDFRPTQREYENKFIELLENAFENLDEHIVVMNTFNNILKNITKEHDRLKLHYKIINVLNEDYIISIETTPRNIKKLNIKYNLNDFF